MRRVTRLQANLRTVFKLVHPYVAEGSGMPFDKTTLEAMPLFVVRREDETAGAGVDVLSQTKKGRFWRQLIRLFPNVIDYLCNPQIDAVKPPTLLLQLSPRRAITRGCGPVFVLLRRHIC